MIDRRVSVDAESGEFMTYEINITPSALAELKEVEAYYRRQITDAIDSQLQHEPTVETRKRKLLVGVEPDFESVSPIWQLRVGDFRVFYDVDESENTVVVRAVREKPPHLQTEEIV
ncbi:MAG: type II toxin-antitoxin system RelE/ParE family toxin [Planctomycetes bacterium]|nr:type II toxin-antitoxin system RelE/ParE family toxin [Planctomycetota bacterium]